MGKDRKKGLKWRILSSITLIMAICTGVTSLVGYMHFHKRALNQKIADEVTKLAQVSRQLQYLAGEISNFAITVVADETLQKAFEDLEQPGTFQKLKSRETINRRLAFYHGIHSYSGGIFVVTEDGETYSSTSISASEDYMNQKLKTPELLAYIGHPDWIFSSPYYGIDTWDGWQVVCFRHHIMDKYHFGNSLGSIYFEINFDYFLDPLRSYAADYDGIWLTGNDSGILFEKEPDSALPDVFEKAGKSSRVAAGYLLRESIPETGWNLCVLIPNSAIYKETRAILIFFLICFISSIVLMLLIMTRRMEKIIRPVTALSLQMEETDYEKLTSLPVVKTGDEIEILYESYNDMVREIQLGIDERIRYEEQKQNMEFDIMLSQINPHYLYNVLNTVVYLSAAGRNKDVVRVTNSLIFSLQETLRLGEEGIETSVQKELELTEHYLEIQKYRYPDRFSVKIDCDEALYPFAVPRVMIQPLVENALIHGILPADRPGEISITVRKHFLSGNGSPEILEIVILDNGGGISDEKIRMFENGGTFADKDGGRKHIGISNIRDRIRYLYKENCDMVISRRNSGGTCVRITVPVHMPPSQL